MLLFPSSTLRLIFPITAFAVIWCAATTADAQPPANAAAAIPRGTTVVSPADDWDTFAVDISIRQWRSGRAAATPAEVSPASFRLERSKTSGDWKTVITVKSLPELKVQGPQGEVTLERKLVVARIEDDENGSPMRMYDSRGEQVQIPASFALPFTNAADLAAGSAPATFKSPGHGQAVRPRPGPGTEWIDRFVTMPGAQQKRKDSLTRQYGAVVGQVRGLDRFLRQAGDSVEEVLTDPQSGAEVEVNRLRNGQLVLRRTIEYQRLASGGLARRLVRTERKIQGDSGQRGVMEIEFANLTFERRGQR